MERNKIQTTNYTIQSNKIQRIYRFAFVSDLHLYPNQPILDTIQSIQPDAVLVGGDFIQSKTDTVSGMDFLAQAARTWPVYCSSGKEHDFDELLIKQIKDTGAIFLRNEYIDFRGIFIGGQNTIPLAGKTREEKEAQIKQNRTWLENYGALSGFKLLLCHHPEYYDLFIRDYDIDLILSGHAHGGQIRLFNRGLWATGQGWFPKYTSGFYNHRLLVGRGIGNTYPIRRVNNKPEIPTVNLCPPKSAEKDIQC